MKNFKRLLNLATLAVFLCSNFLIPINYAQWETPVQNRDNVLMDSLLEWETNSQDFNSFSDYNPEIENQNHGITEETTGQKISEQDESSEISEESREELQQISRTMTMKAISWTSVTLLPGSQFNVAIKKLSGQTGDNTVYDDNTVITKIIQTWSIPLWVTTWILSIANSIYPIYAWYDNWTIYYYTEAEIIYMNQHSNDMFRDCKNLTDISPLSNWNTNNLKDISDIFEWCSSLTDISPLNNWNTSNVTDMMGIFYGCSSLTDISPLSNWNTSNVTDIAHMFYGCSSLTDISPLSNWNTNNVTDMDEIFENCINLTNISALSNWDISNVVDMEGMFYGCSSLTDISPLSNWNTSNVTNMGWGMFEWCSSLTDISPLSNWDTSNVTNMTEMFERCTSLTDVSALNNWHTNNVKYMWAMFRDCKKLKTLNLSNWNTSNVIDMGRLFDGCNKLETIYAGTWFVVSWQASSERMFYGTKNLVWWNGTDWDTNHINAEYARIDTENNPWYFTDINEDTLIVRFETNGWEKIHSQVLEKWAIVNLINPQKKNAIFKGWFIDSWLTENFIGSTPIYSNLKLYAKWECEEWYTEQSNQCIDKNSELIDKNGIIKISDGKDTIYLKDRNQWVDDEIVKDFMLYLSAVLIEEVKWDEIQEECNYDEECMERILLDYINEKSWMSFDNIEELMEYFSGKDMEYIVFWFAWNLYFWGNNTWVNISEMLNGQISDPNEIISKWFDGGKFWDVEGLWWIEWGNNSPCDWTKWEYLPTSQDWERLISIWSNLKGYNAGDISNSMSHFIDSTDSIYWVTLNEDKIYDFVLDTMIYPSQILLTYNGTELERFDTDTFIPAFWWSQSKSWDVWLTILGNADPFLNLSIEYIEADQITDGAVEKINSIALPVRCFIKVPVVKFETNGGNSMDDIDVFKWEKIVLENQPSKANATFDWWYKDEWLTEKWDIENDIVEDDMTLYAKWIDEENKPSWGSSGWWGGWSSSKSDTQKEEKISTNTPEQTSQNNKTQESQTTEQASGETTQDNKQNSQDSQTTSVTTPGWPEFSDEFQQAYTFTKWKWITTMPTIQEAKMNSPLTRISMAKMLSQYAINVLWQEPDTTQNNKFNDVSNKMDADYDNWVTLAYQLGIMWQNMPNNNFRPNDEVTRAEFVTALSRMLFNIEDWKGNIKYYEPHMTKLFSEWIITNTNPKLKEKRWYVMIMLMRTAK